MFLGRTGWYFPVFPIVTDAFVRVLAALVYNNATRTVLHPKYW